MHIGSFLFVDVGHLVQPTIADQSAVWQRQIRLFANNRRLHFHHLRNMIGARFELVRLHPFIDSGQHIAINVVGVVNSAQIFDKIIDAHSTFRFQIRRVQVRVQHDDGKSEHKNGVLRVQPSHNVRIAQAVAL